MKKVLVILLLFSECFCFSQQLSKAAPRICDVPVPPGYAKWRKNILGVQNLVSSLAHDTCLNKKFSVAFHVVLDSSGNWGSASMATLNACINNLNDVFKRICVSFENCHVDEIPIYSYNNWTKPTTDGVVGPNWDLPETINVYLTDSIIGFPAGYAYGPPGIRVVLEKGGAPGVIIHEMGHFFGLVHTWDEIDPGNPVNPPPPAPVGSYEFVARTNCYTHGDGFCDTEADCYPSGFDKYTGPCQHIPGTADGTGEYYVPPVDNYMTYFGCGCRFTQEQYNFMARVILTQRINLH